MANVSFHFEVAAWTSKSSTLKFIGAFDRGTKITVITKQGLGYTYQLPEGACIDANSLENILDMSVGKYWVTRLKPNNPMIDKDETADSWIITADNWINIEQPVPTLKESDWSIGGPGLFAF